MLENGLLYPIAFNLNGVGGTVYKNCTVQIELYNKHCFLHYPILSISNTIDSSPHYIPLLNQHTVN